MFKDYYLILEIDEACSQEQIKLAYRRQALKWHPDRNPGQDTTLRMQDINEAYLILMDIEARARYDHEYYRYKQFKRKAEQPREPEREKQENRANWEQDKGFNESYNYKTQYESRDFTAEDDVLKRWMHNASKQAVDLTKQTLEDLAGMTSAGIKAAVKEGAQAFMFQLGCAFLVVLTIAIISGIRFLMD